ncbi:MAG: hypothetical protein A2234_07480 [Elusimicrobia bacterium RIFOXYA2_FULL_58_8]|nr:MAG: hypothetical protein A2234_07480 [Elusimicrobia bacterium RIFOXYA2_FULL_58_8]OGS13710.1 MAG: hypothetical protein A2285_01245 [Elusimicrobia bacterium RIFOXYA12_FULL_57_11]
MNAANKLLEDIYIVKHNGKPTDLTFPLACNSAGPLDYSKKINQNFLTKAPDLCYPMLQGK